MNLILLDYDISKHGEEIKKQFGAREDCLVIGLDESVPASFAENAPIKGVVITALHSGWLKYHSEITEKYPFVTHWVFCVVGMVGALLRETTAKQFAGTKHSDIYCELIFDDMNFSALTEKLVSPTKTQKKCLVVSLNADLAAEVKALLQEYVQNWEIAVSSDPKPDYSLCDNVLVVGNTLEEMSVAKPEIHSVKVCFWMNAPYFKNKSEISVDKMMLGRQMNEAGWNIGDFSSLVFFSSLHHEQLCCQINQEKLTPVALLSNPVFVLWDDYGLPLAQSKLTEQMILSFLASNTVFQIIADRFFNTKGGNHNEV